MICHRTSNYIYFLSQIQYNKNNIYRKQDYVGEVKFSLIDVDVTTKRLYIATKKNVVASLAIDTGKIDI